MSEIYELEKEIKRLSSSAFINWCIERFILPREIVCPECKDPMKLEIKKSYIEDHCWRCYNCECSARKKRYQIFFNAFFKNIKNVRNCLIAILRIAGAQPTHSIVKTLDISEPSLRKLKNNLIPKMAYENTQMGKLGGIGHFVQIDETMMNFSCKSHRGRSASNRNDAICIVEISTTTNKIVRAWAELLPNKCKTTILPIIKEHVFSNSVIHTDEHASYKDLIKLGYEHYTVCHKYNFVNPINGIHTQYVESFNSKLKYEIKARKGIKSSLRAQFLTEFI